MSEKIPHAIDSFPCRGSGSPRARPTRGVLTILVAMASLGLFLPPGATAQEFCGRTLAEWAQAGANIIDQRNGACGQTLLGSSGADVILGTSCADEIRGKRGNDCIYGFDGNDTLFGDAGHDEIHGGDGNDRLEGDSGRDRLFGGPGGDTLDGSGGRDWLDGGPGDDVLDGQSRSDQLFGGPGDDRLTGDRGRDQLFGGWGDDRLKGDAGADLLCGQGGSDSLKGDARADRLDGGLGVDDCDGDSGGDRCWRCESTEKCAGQSGSLCTDDSNVLSGVADPGCTVCARNLANGMLYCTVARSDGSFDIDSGRVPPSTDNGALPAMGNFQVFCIDCQGDGVPTAPNGAPVDVRCTACAGTEVVAGTCNLFQGCSPGNPPEEASPSPALYQHIYQNRVLATPNNPRPPLDFDELPGQGGIPADSAFGHTFEALPAGICGATLTVTAEAGGGATNDSLALELANPGGPFAWSGTFANLTGLNWNFGDLGTATLDLSNLPGGQNLLASLADGRLDVYAQDDTSIDCMRLCLQLCTDLTLDKELVGGGLGQDGPEWRFALTVRNIGTAASGTTITVTDTLPPGLSFVSGSGTDWACSAIDNVVTCTYSGPPIAVGGSSRIDLVVEPSGRGTFQDLENCAQVSMPGDTNPNNDQACLFLPCPSQGDPLVRQIPGSNTDPGICEAADPEACGEDSTWYWGTCGCGCIDPEPCPDPQDPRVSFVSQNVGFCAIVQFVCGTGETLFSNACGCGCIVPDECPAPSDPDVDYVSRDLERCAELSAGFPACYRGGWFDGPCGCGCVRFGDPVDRPFFGTAYFSVTSQPSWGGDVGDLRYEVDPGEGLGAAIELGWRRGRIAVVAGLDYQRTETRVEVGPIGAPTRISEERDDSWLVTAGVRWNLTPRQPFALTLGPVVGWFDLADPPGFDLDSDLGFGLDLGFRTDIGPRFGVTGRLRYLEVDFDFESPLLGRGDDTLEQWSLGLGIAF